MGAGAQSNSLEPLVADDARLGTLAAGTPVVERERLELERIGVCKETRRSTFISAALLFAPIPVAATG